MKKIITIFIIIVIILTVVGYVLIYKLVFQQQDNQSVQETVLPVPEKIPFNTNDNLDEALQDLNYLE